MIYNKLLDITEDDVLAQKDLNVLIKWRLEIEEQIAAVKKRIELLDESSSEMPRARDAKRHRNLLVNTISLQIKVEKRSQNKEILLMRKFMKAAKKELGGEQYKKILEQAKILAGFK